MNNKKIIREYYASELKKVEEVKPAPFILKSEPKQTISSKKLSWEHVFGCLITAAYLFQFLVPERWFSFGKFFFPFRFGF